MIVHATFATGLPTVYVLCWVTTGQYRAMADAVVARQRPFALCQPFGMVWVVGPWRYGLTLLPGLVRPDDARDAEKVDRLLRARSELGWELVSVVTARDGSDLFVFRQSAE